MNQEQIDRDTARLARLIKSVRKYADDLCEAGDSENSARFRRVEGYLTLAYAEGRTVCVQDADGGVIRPLSGTK